MAEYPQILLPKETYKLKIELTESEAQELYLIRKSLLSKEETLNEVGAVRNDAFLSPGKEHLFFSLSCNLLGLYLKEHLVYVLGKDEGKKYYVKKDQIADSKEIEFTVQSDACPIYLNVARVFNQPLNYAKGNEKQKIEAFTGTCSVVHKPIAANYWHFEISVRDAENAPITPGEKGWKTTAATSFFESYLKLHLSCDDVSGSVDERIYLESSKEVS